MSLIARLRSLSYRFDWLTDDVLKQPSSKSIQRLYADLITDLYDLENDVLTNVDPSNQLQLDAESYSNIIQLNRIKSIVAAALFDIPADKPKDFGLPDLLKPVAKRTHYFVSELVTMLEMKYFLVNQLKPVENEVEERLTELDRKKDQLARLQQKVKKMREDKAKNVDQAAKLRQNVQTAQVNLVKRKEEVAEFSKLGEQLEARHSSEEGACKELKERLEKRKKECIGLDHHIASSPTRTRSQIAHLTQQFNAAQQDGLRLESELQQVSQTCLRLEQVDKNLDLVLDLEAQAQSAKKDIDGKIGEREKKRAQVEKGKQSIDDDKTQLTNKGGVFEHKRALRTKMERRRAPKIKAKISEKDNLNKSLMGLEPGSKKVGANLDAQIVQLQFDVDKIDKGLAQDQVQYNEQADHLTKANQKMVDDFNKFKDSQLSLLKEVAVQLNEH